MDAFKIAVISIIIFPVSLFHIQCRADSKKTINNHDELFNHDWKFSRDSIPGAERPEFDDANWMSVDLPHDYSIMDLPDRQAGLTDEDTDEQIGPFSKKSPGNGNSTGHAIGGTGWYRKSFILEKEDQGKTTILKFDGIYMESEVWVNGQKVGENKNGYTPFWFDITSYLNEVGIPNLIAVKVDNYGRNSRWYSGSGIYRNVHLSIVDPVHVAPWGVYVTTPDVSPDAAMVNVRVSIQNDTENNIDAKVSISMKDSAGQLAGSITKNIKLSGESSQIIEGQIVIKNPDLWTLENPTLYTAEVILESGKKVKDNYRQKFGIRTIEISAEKGFVLNGKTILLKGGCLHHDNGLLGAAAFERAEIRKVELMKTNGYNAIRCAHNPPSEIFLEACDRLGILVINEFTDMWETYKNPQDYSLFFKDHWKNDLTNMILRDRNHPSIIMWSIGNEILKNSVEDAIRIGSQLSEHVRSMDDTRFVTEAVSSLFTPGGWENTGPIFALHDATGYNYIPGKYESDHKDFPDRIMYSSESFPLNAYDYWKAAEENPYVIGDFVWTAMDYIGEVAIANSTYVPEKDKVIFKLPEKLALPPGFSIWDYMQRMPSSWPNYISWCGDMDITGQKKPQSFYRDVLWDNSPIEINVHEYIPEGMAENVSGWGWPKELPQWYWPGNEGKSLEVRVFTKSPEVKLFLNGTLIGKKLLTTEDKYVASFTLPYQSGELKAVALENGKEVSSKILITPGKPATIRLIAERKEINADRSDLAYVNIEVVDQNGRLIPQDTFQLSLSVSGDGELIASGNASPNDMESVNNSVIKTYQGKAQAIIRPNEKARVIRFKVAAEGLLPGEITIMVSAVSISE